MKKRNWVVSLLVGGVIAAMLAGCNVTYVPVESSEENVKEDENNIGDLEAEEEIVEEPEAGEDLEVSEAVNTLAVKAKGYSGLTNLTNENNEDGTYFYEDMTEDGLTVIINMSAPNTMEEDQSAEEYVKGFVSAKVKPECSVTEVEANEDLSGELTYPVYEVAWEWGSNEDSTCGVGEVILTDNYTFYYGYSCPIDFYEDNEEFYEDELESIELMDLTELKDSDEGEFQIDKTGMASELKDEYKDETSENTEAEDEYVEAVNEGEKETDEEYVTRASGLDSETDYKASDIAGCWKYADYEDIYLAFYDSGRFEIHEIQSDDIVSEGEYTVDGTTIEAKEEGEESSQYLQIESKVRLKDDEGDIMVPYVPENEIAASTGGDNVARAGGSGSGDDLQYKDAGKGLYELRSPSRHTYLKYPYQYYANADGDFLYVYDGTEGYVTGRNITLDYQNWSGDAKSFVDKYADHYLMQDFQYFYGKAESAADIKRVYNPKKDIVSRVTANLWNGRYDIQCSSVINFSRFKDGTIYLMMINKFYTYGSKDAFNRVSPVVCGGAR
ncbi:MAG: hypothetical protein K6E98_01310 [Lachnospiraceae bacterium]|nr:hypothetical protein [Lachnospiraceae bacterium]